MGNSQSHEVDLSVVMQLSDEQLVKSIYSINVVQKSSNLNYFTYIILKKKKYNYKKPENMSDILPYTLNRQTLHTYLNTLLNSMLVHGSQTVS